MLSARMEDNIWKSASWQAVPAWSDLISLLVTCGNPIANDTHNSFVDGISIDLASQGSRGRSIDRKVEYTFLGRQMISNRGGEIKGVNDYGSQSIMFNHDFNFSSDAPPMEGIDSDKLHNLCHLVIS